MARRARVLYHERMDNILINKRPMDSHDWLIDVLIAVVAFFLGCAQLALTQSTIVFRDETFRNMIGIATVTPNFSAFVMLSLTTLPLVLRRRFPWLVFVFTFVVYLAVQSMLPGYSMALFGPMVALFTVVNEQSRTEVIIACVVTLAALWLVGIGGQNDSFAIIMRIQNTSYMAIAVVAGLALHTYERYVAETEQRAIAAEKGREEEAARRVEEERVRIAREIHDITAHSLTAVSIQAAAAEKLIDRNPEAAKEAIQQVRSTSKTALEEIRSMIGVLRNEGQAAETAPTAGTDRMDDLRSYAENAGLQVHLDWDHYDKHAVPAYIDVALFGIAREAVTNVVRHAQAHELWISLSQDADGAHLRVEDDGVGRAATPAETEGHGLQGMEERARVLHGTFSARNRTQGGYSVSVDIPFDEKEQA